MAWEGFRNVCPLKQGSHFSASMYCWRWTTSKTGFVFSYICRVNGFQLVPDKNPFAKLSGDRFGRRSLVIQNLPASISNNALSRVLIGADENASLSRVPTIRSWPLSDRTSLMPFCFRICCILPTRSSVSHCLSFCHPQRPIDGVSEVQPPLITNVLGKTFKNEFAIVSN